MKEDEKEENEKWDQVRKKRWKNDWRWGMKERPRKSKEVSKDWKKVREEKRKEKVRESEGMKEINFYKIF